MGIVFKQSLKNTLIIYTAFGVGGINALFLYTHFLKDEYYGLVTYLLSTANLLMPLTAFGVQYSILKFFSSYSNVKEQHRFLSSMLLLPLFITLPIGFIGNWFYEEISNLLSLQNPIIKEYTFVIYLVAIATAYFEVFYAWSKVQLQSVLGTLLKEFFSRIAAAILLVCVFLDWISKEEFVYYLTAAYFLRMLLMMFYAFRLHPPVLSLRFPGNFKEVLRYSVYVILAGAAGTILLDIDKFMIPQKEAIAQTAYYAVAVYIGSVIEVPGRAMAQILQPLTAKALNENKMQEIHSLYKKSSINLLTICGLIFLLINLNIGQLYELLPSKYAGGVWVVMMISIAKLYHMLLGNNGAIITNSKYYKILLPYGIIMSVCVILLNYWLIDVLGINGAALATLIVVLVFNTVKIWYVERKFKMLPFTNKTGTLIVVIVVLFALFYFWDFPFHPVLNILIKSGLITIVYLYLIKRMHISSDINKLLKKLMR